MMTYRNYIDGGWQESASGKTFADINPANREDVISYFQQSTVADVRNAVDSAKQAFQEWKRFPPGKRVEILHRVLSLLRERKENLARELTLEEGKTLRESVAEIESAIAEMEFQISQGKRIFGKSFFAESDRRFCYSVREPLGAASILTPWNFPINVPCRKITPALVSGNTVIFKPASFTPLTALRLVEIFVEAGIPKGVLNFITGSGSEIGDEIVSNPSIKAVSFTGSTDVGMRINRIASANMTKVQLEMGGKNPAIVLEDSDLEFAVDSIILAAYSCSGQWCTSTSRAILIEKIADKFIDILVEKVKKIRVGNGLDPEVMMGPVAGESQLKKILDYVELGKNQGAKLIFGGKRLTGPQYDKGFFIEPTIFTNVKPEMKIAQEEIFGPVLSVMTVDSFEKAAKVANDVSYGLSSSIYTKGLAKAMVFINETEVGLTHVNLPTSYKEPQLPFGGIKLSGCGLPEAGESGIEFFTQNKSVYIQPLQTDSC